MFCFKAPAILFFLLITILFYIAVNIQSGWLFVLDFSLLAFGLVSWMVTMFWARGEIQINRFLPQAFEGEMLEIVLRITNTSRWHKYFLTIKDSFPSSNVPRPFNFFIPVLRRMETIELTYKERAEKRGVFKLEPIGVSCLSPSLFFQFKKNIRPLRDKPLIIYPSLRPFQFALEGSSLGPVPGETGISFGKGGGEDFFGVRQYEAGDSLRTIHWPNSAKAGKLMIKEMSKSYPSVFTFYLDQNLDSAFFEEIVHLAAFAIQETLRKGHEVLLFDNKQVEPKNWWGALEALAFMKTEESASLAEQLKKHLPILLQQKEILFFTVSPKEVPKSFLDCLKQFQEAGVLLHFYFLNSNENAHTLLPFQKFNNLDFTLVSLHA